jgi:hypothetical protein
MPGTGAYAVPIELGTGAQFADPNNKNGVVPLPPTNNTGAVDFNPVFVSLAHANISPSAVAPVTVTIAIYRQAGGGPQVLTIPIPPGTRVGLPQLSPTAPGDLAVGITAPGAPTGTMLTALVEYGTP